MTLLVTELKDTATKISDYFGAISNYIGTGTGTPPGIEEVLPTISTDVTQEISQSIKLGSNSYSSGIISTALYENQAFIREANMVTSLKFQFYEAEAADLALQANNLQAEVAKKINYIQGRSPEQNITL